MAGECTNEMMLEHSQDLGILKQGYAGLREDVNRHEHVYDILMEMSTTQGKTLVAIEKQGVVQEAQSLVLNKVVTDVDFLKENAEDKKTVQRLHGKVEELENMFDDHKDTEKDEELAGYHELKKYVTKIIIGAAVFVLTALIIFAVIILIGMANTGALPT